MYVVIFITHLFQDWLFVFFWYCSIKLGNGNGIKVTEPDFLVAYMFTCNIGEAVNNDKYGFLISWKVLTFNIFGFFFFSDSILHYHFAKTASLGKCRAFSYEPMRSLHIRLLSFPNLIFQDHLVVLNDFLVDDVITGEYLDESSFFILQTGLVIS